jgi:hypothetical protein
MFSQVFYASPLRIRRSRCNCEEYGGRQRHFNGEGFWARE